MTRSIRWTPVLVLLALLLPQAPASSAPPPFEPPELPAVREGLDRGESQELFIWLEDEAVRGELDARQASHGLARGSQPLLDHLAQRLDGLKAEVLRSVPAKSLTVVRRYSHLPLVFARFRTPEALNAVLANPRVRGVLTDGTVEFSTSESLPLIEQPVVAQHGHKGAGTAIAVLDTGVGYQDPSGFFGPVSACQQGSFGSACKVAAAKNCLVNDCASNSGPFSYFTSHGTLVAATALSVAPAAKVVSLQVFSAGGASENESRWSYVSDAVNWAISNKSTYNIVAANMSFNTCRYKDGVTTNGCKQCQRYGSHCTEFNSVWSEDFTAVILTHSLWSSGIITTASAGNSGFVNGLTSPACTPWVMSVGAVFDSTQTFGPSFDRQCRQTSSLCANPGTLVADQIPCYSSSATYLDMLAPGHKISASGHTGAGTSHAAPHVAGAVAVVRSSYPSMPINEVRDWLIETGEPVTDPRMSGSPAFPRLNLCRAVFGQLSFICD